MFARCSFYDPHLALRYEGCHRGRNAPAERWSEGGVGGDGEQGNTGASHRPPKEMTQHKCCSRRLRAHVRLPAFALLRVCAASCSLGFRPFMHASTLRR